MRLQNHGERCRKSLASISKRPNRKRPRLAVETLEGRDMPTVVFTPHFGQENVAYHGGELLSSPDVHLIFWGAEWQTAPLSQLASDIQTQAATLLSGPYLSGLQQYSFPGIPNVLPPRPIDGHAQLGKVVFDTSVNFATATPQNKFTDDQLQDVISHQVDRGALPDSDDTSHAPIYVVLTPPPVKSDTPNAIGYHSDFLRFSFPFDFDHMHYAWVSGGGRQSADAYLTVFSHEIVESIVDPRPESGWTSDQPGFPSKKGNDEIADWEPEETFMGTTARVDGVLAQAYYSAADQAFIVPDGNDQKFVLTRNRDANDNPLNTFVLTLTGDQRRGTADDNLLLFTTNTGGVAFFLNGETREFAPGQITRININLGTGTDGVNVASTPSGVPVFITQGSNAATTINLFPSGSGLFLGKIQSDIFFDAPPSGTGTESFSSSTININDSLNNDPLVQTWTIADNTLTGKPLGLSRIHYTGLGNLNVSTNGSPSSVLVTGTGGLAHVTVSTANKDDVFRIEKTTRDTIVTINSGDGADVTTIGDASQTLDAIQGRVEVNGGGADTLHLFDQNSVRSNTTYTLDATTFVTPLTSVTYAGIKDLIVDGSAGVVNLTRTYTIRGLGATGVTTLNTKGLINQINVGSTSNTLDGFTPDGPVLSTIDTVSPVPTSFLGFSGRLNINGPNSIDKIVLNDSQNTKPGTSYTINPGSVTRFVPSPLSVLLSSEVTVSYTAGFGSSVELDTAKGGATIQDNGSNIFANVVAGSGADTLIGPNVSTTWGVTGVNQGTLPNLAFRGVENLVGGTANDTFAFADGARVTERIDGGTGNNALDFARYTTDVTANLTLGKSTGAGGGIVHINDVAGGQGNDILVGDDSDNVFIGGPGRNILIGGQGSDTLNASTGGLGEDILIGGEAKFDRSTSALNLIKAEWTRPDTLLSNYKTRVDHLMNGGGLNGLIRLNVTTVFADGARDLVNSSATAGLDLLGLDIDDILSGPLKPGEQVIRV